jgi:hypothetical protein
MSAATKTPAALTIRDAAGAVVRELDGSADAGFNRVVWDLRSQAPASLAGQRGPLVVPGTYSVAVRAGGRESKSSVRVDPDPTLPMTDAERQSRFTFLTETLTLRGDVARAAGDVRGVRDQVTALQEQLKGEKPPASSVVDAAARLGKTLADLQGRLGGGGGGGGGEEGGGGGGGGLSGRLAGLFSQLDGSGIHQGTLFGPTPGLRQLLDAARQDVQALRADVDRALGAELTALNDEIARAKIPRIVRPR